MQRNLFVVMRLGSPVVLSYLDAGFEPQLVARTLGLLAASSYLLLNTKLKTPIFHPKWTTGRHCSAEDAFFITHLQGFDCIIVVQEQQR